MAETRLIGIDWGTSRLRAYRIGEAAAVIERREALLGILAVTPGGFEDALRGVIGDWLDAAGDVPTLASGMVSSRQGWFETPYLPCPAGLDELAAALHPLTLRDGRRLHLVTGLASRTPDDAPDVMRGEETQILGALRDGAGRQLFVLPGTHSKWALVEAGRILRFATFLTGELYGALRDHTILGRTMAGDGFDAAAFAAGVRRGQAEDGPDGGLLHRLFGVRTLGLFGELPATAAAAYLSGLLIGAEIREGTAIWGRGHAVELVGNVELASRYERAMALLGRPSRLCPEDVTARGHWRIARRAGLVAA